MYEHVIFDADFELIQLLPKENISTFYLAEGTALALQIGHRYSNDFDFFIFHEFNNEILKQQLSFLGKPVLFQDSKDTLEISIKNMRFTFLRYTYPLLEELVTFKNIKLASIRDLSAMKLSALSSRGSRKDFIDLFFIHKTANWEKTFMDFEKKYKNSGYNLYHIIKSLSYFDDALQEPMPRMIKECEWEKVKQTFLEVQRKLADNYL